MLFEVHNKICYQLVGTREKVDDFSILIWLSRQGFHAHMHCFKFQRPAIILQSNWCHTTSTVCFQRFPWTLFCVCDQQPPILLQTLGPSPQIVSEFLRPRVAGMTPAPQFSYASFTSSHSEPRSAWMHQNQWFAISCPESENVNTRLRVGKPKHPSRDPHRELPSISEGCLSLPQVAKSEQSWDMRSEGEACDATPAPSDAQTHINIYIYLHVF